jgi:hypothetical protein
MEKQPAFDTPSKVKAKDGTVKVRGPDDVEVDLTPEAAEETSDRLLNEAMKARGNRRLKDLPHQPQE